jgi:hypothetical protein
MGDESMAFFLARHPELDSGSIGCLKKIRP